MSSGQVSQEGIKVSLGGLVGIPGRSWPKKVLRIGILKMGGMDHKWPSQPAAWHFHGELFLYEETEI